MLKPQTLPTLPDYRSPGKNLPGRWHVNYQDENGNLIFKSFKDCQDADIYYQSLINKE